MLVMWPQPSSAAHVTVYNLEERTVAGAELYKEGFYRTIRAAAQALYVPYKRLWSRVQGHQPVQQNGGLNKLFSPSEEREILCWSHRRITQGHHITSRTLRQHANAILKAKGEELTISRTWVKNFIKRNKKLFHAKKAASRDAKRKAMQDRVRVEAFFRDWRDFLIRRRIEPRNVWNFDETGFMIGYLNKGTFVWTFNEIETPILTDSHDTVSITAIEAISASGNFIPSFLILPGVNIPLQWTQNALDRETILTTSLKGYINDIIAIEWIEHFERHTRPRNPKEIRVLLMDGCESHFTSEIVHFCKQHSIELFPLPPHLTHLLQPLDVGVFRSYKYWHQQVLYREVADGATDFKKTDFLFHLQEVRNRTFKKATILSAWQKCGLFPHNPSIVLDELQDALSSLTQVVREQDLPGYISDGSSQSSEADGEAKDDPVFATPQRPPKTPPARGRFDWKTAQTPKLNLAS
ncbi:hypothetical protein HIM_11081 [Hirsutella minnesotensis 3608]|uniref:HTH CENPB-type domain-containing protein n=1 Tax=Hirsutella minnesotensis 3608 TaxID=1043627 RepID=A0A0F8A1M1_9HYPO|nr:hypothetical protein HIM_11081 [Hirsutella minnesotensis 3608]